MVSVQLVPMKGSGEEEGDSSLLYSFEILENSGYLEVGVKGGEGLQIYGGNLREIYFELGSFFLFKLNSETFHFHYFSISPDI